MALLYQEKAFLSAVSRIYCPDLHSEQKCKLPQLGFEVVYTCLSCGPRFQAGHSHVSRGVRGDMDEGCRDEPFGGMQIIAFGDFYQLPPAYRAAANNWNGNGNERSDRRWRPFCFDSHVWEDLGLSDNIVQLKDVQRQENEDFVNLLNPVRIGNIRETDIVELNSRCLIGESNPLPTDGIVPTRLYVLNKDVDLENISRLAELNGKEVVCKAEIRGERGCQ